MKTLLRLPLAFGLLLTAFTVPLRAQEPVTTGTVERVDVSTGEITVRSDQTKRPITFLGADKATLTQNQGQPATLADLKAGMMITLQYAVRGQQWYVSKIMVAETPAAGAAPAGAAAAAPGAATLSPPGTLTLPGAVLNAAPLPTTSATGTTPLTSPGMPKAPANADPASVGATDPVRPSGGSVVRNRSGGNRPSPAAK